MNKFSSQTESEQISLKLEKYDSCYGGIITTLFSLLHERFDKLSKIASTNNDDILYNEIDKTWVLLTMLQNQIPETLFEDLEQLTFLTLKSKKIS